MAKFTLRVNTEGDAFQVQRSAELVSILRGLADKIDAHGLVEGELFRLRDSNGNRVGFAIHEEG